MGLRLNGGRGIVLGYTPDLAPAVVAGDGRRDGGRWTALRDPGSSATRCSLPVTVKGRLPNGYLTALVVRTDKSQAELGHRSRFAAFASDEGLAGSDLHFYRWAQQGSNLITA